MEMENSVKITTASPEAFSNSKGCPVINNDKISEMMDSPIKGESCVTKGCENGKTLQQCNSSESVMPKEKERVLKRFNYNESPPTKLIGDDGTTILVKDVTASKTTNVNSSAQANISKDNDNDSGIACLSTERNKSWLLRLFESKLFDSSMAISYMFNSKEPGVLGYIGNRLFTYPDSEVDFYLPQLVSMYIMSHEVAEVIHPYIIHRCRNSVDFSLRCAWLLEAYVASDNATSSNKKKAQHGIKLKNLILSGELVPKEKCNERDKLQKPKKTIYTHSQMSNTSSSTNRRTPGHVRSRSDATGLLSTDEARNNMKPFTTATFLPDHATAATVGSSNYCYNSTVVNNDCTNMITPLMGGGVGGARYTHQPLYPNPKYNAILQSSIAGRNHPNSLNSTPAKPKLCLGDLASGRAFENGCTCFESCKAAVNDLCGRKTYCTCGAPRLAPQQEFIRALLSIGKRLGALQTQGGNSTISQNKEAKTQRLLAELSMLNLNLPARAWIPIHSDIPHLVVRVPPQAATVLNSKDRAPYIIYVECIEVDDVSACPVPQKIVNSATTCASQKNNFQENIPGTRVGRTNETSHKRSKSVERLMERRETIESTNESRISSTGCGTGSTSTGESTSSSSPGFPVGNEGQCTKEEPQEDNHRTHQEGQVDNSRMLSLGNSASTISLPVMMLPNFQTPGSFTGSGAGSGGIPDIDCWSQEDDELTLQYPEFRSLNSFGCAGSKGSSLSRRDAAFAAPDTISMMSIESTDSSRAGINTALSEPIFIAAGDIRRRLSESLKEPKGYKTFKRDPDDPSASVLKEPWEAKVSRIRDSSPYGNIPNWKLLACIVKCGDDLRQELLAYQILKTLQSIWKEEKVPLWVRPYRILVLSNDSGLIEPILNTISLHQVKKHGRHQVKLCSDSSTDNMTNVNEDSVSNDTQNSDPSSFTLLKYFLQEFGPETSEEFMEAQQNFVQSCAAYCIVSYLVQVKDRHNGNILLDNEGHLIHIDYGFILSASPKNLGFENSPFKLTPEFVDVMGGQNSDMFKYFKLLILQGFIAARKHSDKILSLIDIMRAGSQLPCFTSGSASSAQMMKSRFHMNLTEEQLLDLVNNLVDQAINSLTTKLYDGFQYYSNGIL